MFLRLRAVPSGERKNWILHSNLDFIEPGVFFLL